VSRRKGDHELRIEARVIGRGRPIPTTVIARLGPGGRYGPPAGQVLFRDAAITNVDFRSTSWDDFRANGSTFVGCDFSMARFAHAVFSHVPRQTTYRSCRFDEADLRNAFPGDARFENCSFDRARLEDWLSLLAEFVGCHFAGRVQGAVFLGRPFGPGAEKVIRRRRTNEFRDNDFREAELVDCDFRGGIEIRRQLWPTDPAYIYFDRAQERIATAKEIVSAWPESEARRLALVMLTGYSIGGSEQQEEIFTRRHDPSGTIPREVRDKVWRIIEQI
jgi:uncharacterized protein YjbI with pentapeptide repeats